MDTIIQFLNDILYEYISLQYLYILLYSYILKYYNIYYHFIYNKNPH